MTKYLCGHESTGIIILDDNLLSMSAYVEWSESVGVFGDRSICWQCWNKETTPNKVNWDEKLKNKPCQLCERVTEEKVHFFVGGFIAYAHNSCLDIFQKGVELKDRWNKMQREMNRRNYAQRKN